MSEVLQDQIDQPEYLTVADLRKQLEGLPDDMPVYLSRDPEGNGYMPLYEVSRGAYYSEQGDMYFEEHGWDGNNFDDEEEWQAFKDETPECVVLSP